MSAFSNLKPIYSASVIIHSKSASGYDALADSTAKADPETSAPNDSLPPQHGKDEGTKNYSLDHIFACTNPNVLADKTKSVSDWLETVLTTPETGTRNAAKPKDDIIIVVDDSKEDEEEGKNDEIHSTTNNETEDTSASTPPSPSSLPTELKELPSKFNELTDEVKALKTHVHGLEIEVPGDLKSLPTKLEEFTTTVASAQAKLKTLDALLSPLLKVTQALIMFAKVLHSATSKAGDQRVPSTGQASTMPAEGEKNTNQKAKKFNFITEDGKHIHLIEEQINQQKKIEEEAKAEAARREGEIRKEELIDLLGPKVVNKYYNDKLQYDRYCDKMLNRRAKSRITNYDILTRKGPITLKVYRLDDTSEIIPEFKANDLHLGEWREVVTACPNKKGKGWTSIYKQIHERMDYLRTTEAELGIDLDRPLSEQDPLDRLNDLANKKRKHADDIHDFFRANKRLKSSVQYKDHLDGIVLNEPVLGRDDHARTFSSLLLAEVDKRNVNPIKQMRVIEQLRQ
ncbi:hypothetical protein Tco_0700806 [Tanacetum coccineum]